MFPITQYQTMYICFPHALHSQKLHKLFCFQKVLIFETCKYEIETFYVILGNGFIPTSCLREILRELDDQLNDADLDGMIEEIDGDGSGTVDFDEFM